MLAIVLAAAVPALAQSATLGGDGDAGCVQTAIQQQIGNVQQTVVGDNVNAQAIAQSCNISITQVKNIFVTIGVSKAGKVVNVSKFAKFVTGKVIASASASAKTVTASAKASAPSVQYKTVTASAAPSVQYQYAAAAVQYQYSAPVALPETGGSSLLVPVGALLLLAGGGLLAFFVVRRGFTG